MRAISTAAWLLLACACSGSSSSRAAATDAGEDATTCQPDELVLTGPAAETPHGYYSLSSVQLTGDSFSANLPGGGGIELSWAGDATSGSVPVIGQIVVATGPASTSTWCLATPSTLAIRGTFGVLDLRVLAAHGPCDAMNDAGSDYEPITGCFDATPATDS